MSGILSRCGQKTRKNSRVMTRLKEVFPVEGRVVLVLSQNFSSTEKRQNS